MGETTRNTLPIASWAPILMNWRQEAYENFLLILESPFETLNKPSSLIHYDDVINDLDDELVMVKRPNRRPREINFTLQQKFYNRDISLNQSKSIMKKFELEHIKTDGRKVTARYRSKSMCTPLSIRVPKVLEYRKFLMSTLVTSQIVASLSHRSRQKFRAISVLM